MKEVRVKQLPNCDLCMLKDKQTPAMYDGKTKDGPWANMCEAHFQSHGVGLGTGRGQRLTVETELEQARREHADRAKTYTTLKEIRSDRMTIPAGSQVSIGWTEAYPYRAIVYYGEGHILCGIEKLHEKVKGIRKPPRMSEKLLDSVVSTPTGHRVEPDGRGPDGSPAWTLILGLV